MIPHQCDTGVTYLQKYYVIKKLQRTKIVFQKVSLIKVFIFINYCILTSN